MAHVALTPAFLGVAFAASLCLFAPVIASAPGCLDPGILLTCLASAGPTMQAGSSPAAIVLTVLTLTFAAAVAIAAACHVRGARSLRRAARPTTLHGLDVRLVAGLDGAVVAGLARPTIYCSDGLPERLDDDELQAVLLHERHHQLVLAPLRLVVLSALAPFLGWSRAGGGWLVARRAGIEIAADAHALELGVPRAVLARAIVRLMDDAYATDAPGFTSAADLRLRALVASDPSAGVTPPTPQFVGVVAFVATCAILALV